MKKSTKIVIIFAFIISIGISFCAGSCMNEHVNSQNRKQGCNNLISFAMDKANSGDLNDPDTMEALISNVYAAYLYCDDPVSGE